MKITIARNWQDVDTKHFSNCIISNNETNTYNMEKHKEMKIKYQVKNPIPQKRLKEKILTAKRMVHVSVDST